MGLSAPHAGMGVSAMTSVWSSWWAVAVSASATIVAVFIGATLAFWARRHVATMAAKTAATLKLFDEFHSVEFIAHRRRAYERLQREDADGVVRTLPLCIEIEDDKRRDALLAVAYFFEKLSVLWAQKRVDRRLLASLLGRYVGFYGDVLFARDGGDAADREWGDWATIVKASFADIHAQAARARRRGGAR